MRILVCISCVPDTTSKISFIDSKKFDSNGIQYIIGPYEDYGLARAVGRAGSKYLFTNDQDYRRLV